MSNQLRNQLLELGAERLVDALMRLANRDDAARDLVNRMLASPNENILRYQKKLQNLKKPSNRFVSYHEAESYVEKLRSILEDLELGVSNPQQGVALVAEFYRCDSYIMEQCDDSNGTIGDFFSYDLQELFTSFAGQCEDKEWVVEIVLGLIDENDYGVRDTLIDHASEYLPGPVLRGMVERLKERALVGSNEYKQRSYCLAVRVLAKQLQDPFLMAEAQIAAYGTPSTSSHLEIAQVHLDRSEPQEALQELAKISEEERFMESQKDDLLLEAHRCLGHSKEAAEIAWKIFRRGRSIRTLKQLLEIIGENHRDQIMADERAAIHSNAVFSVMDLIFLVESEQLEEGERYVVEREAQVDGGLYTTLLPLAERMENEGYYLSATVMYRALLDSILARGYIKAYSYGARYLRKLDVLASRIIDWKKIDDHSCYRKRLEALHHKKRSFWSK